MTLNQERVIEHGTLSQYAVLVAVDGSRNSLRAADYAVGLACRTGSAVVGVYVCRVTPLAIGTPAVWVYAETAQEQVADEAMEYIAVRAKEVGAPYGFVVLNGSPSRQIRHLAGQLQASALVVGAPQQLAHRVCGSLAARSIRCALTCACALAGAAVARTVNSEKRNRDGWRIKVPSMKRDRRADRRFRPRSVCRQRTALGMRFPLRILGFRILQARRASRFRRSVGP